MKEIECAIVEWVRLLGPSRVLLKAEANREYVLTPQWLSQSVVAAIIPRSANEVSEIVKIACRFKVPLYPVCGNNMQNYGGSNPPQEGCAILELSNLNKIGNYDSTLGIVTIEAGVTYQQLYDYLLTNGGSHRAPEGPMTSQKDTIAGILMERDYTINRPHLNERVISVEAVLPNGDMYYSPLRSSSYGTIPVFKWGVGPYLDGLFSSGGLGIVTRMTISLCPSPARIEPFTFQFENKHLRKACQGIRNLIQSMGSMFYTRFAWANRFRVLASMGVPYPSDKIPGGGATPSKVLSELCSKYGVLDWKVTSSILAFDEGMVKAARKLIIQEVGGFAQDLIFVTPGLVNKIIQHQKSEKPGAIDGSAEEKSYVDFQTRIKWYQSGELPELTGKINFWKSHIYSSGETAGNPQVCGYSVLTFYAIIPFDYRKIQAAIKKFEEIIRDHQNDPMFQVVCWAPTFVFLRAPLLFNPTDNEDVRRAHACYHALLQESLKQGLPPCRMASFEMRNLFSLPNQGHLRRQVKHALDPARLIAPDR